MKNYHRCLLLAALLALGTAASPAATTVFISIDNTGANIPVHVSNPRTWNFGITAAGANQLTVGSSLFGLNKGGSTVDPIIYSIYSGFGRNVGGNSLLRSVTLQPSDGDDHERDELDAGLHGERQRSEATTNPQSAHA